MSIALDGSQGARIAAAAATACGIALVLTPPVRMFAVRSGLVAKPLQDRWGRRLIARLGGVAMFAAFLSAMVAWVPLVPPMGGLLFGLGMVFLLGLADDLWRLPPYTKLVGQLLIGCLVVVGGIRFTVIPWPWLSIPLSVLWFVLLINAFNLLDNMDGLAAGVGAIAAGVCAAHAALAGQGTVAATAAILAGVCVGFLRYNFPPAKIFMGDAGSHLLGLALAALAIMESNASSTRLLGVLAVPTLVLAVPIFDTCFVTIQRLAHGQHPFVGGTDHVSHRLAILGLTTRQTVGVLYGISACLGLLGVASTPWPLLSVLAIWSSVLMFLLLLGLYLAKVNVYRVEHGSAMPANEAPARAETHIDTTLLHKRRLLEVLVDFGLISSAYVFAHLLRFEGQLSADLQELIAKSLPILLVVKLGCFWGYGLYRGVWRYVGLSDAVAIVKAVTVGSTASALILLYVWRFEGFSRAVLVIDWMLSLLAIGGGRLVERLLDEWIRGMRAGARTVLIVGAGDTGAHLLRWLQTHEPDRRRVAAFLDDDPATHGSCIVGVPIVGGRERLDELVRRWNVREVLVAIPDPPGQLLEEVRRCCEPLGVRWQTVTAGLLSSAE